MTSQTFHVRCRQVDKTTQQYVSREVAKQANKPSWFLMLTSRKRTRLSYILTNSSMDVPYGFS